MIRKIAEDIAQELLSMENRRRKLKGDRLEMLICSVEKLVKDSVSIRFSRSRYNWATIKKHQPYYTCSHLMRFQGLLTQLFLINDS